MITTPPNSYVLSQFGCTDNPLGLEGGEGRTWCSGNVVLKQVDPRNAGFDAGVISQLAPKGYRLATPISSADGEFSIEGWSAYSQLEGRHEVGKMVAERFETSRLFHRDLAAFPFSQHFEEMSDPWTIAQRITFGTQEWVASIQIGRLWETIQELDHATRDRWQIIHADLAGNFLFEPGLDPAIIDLTLKWSPSGFAEAVMAVDMALWEGVELERVLSLLTKAELELSPLAISRRLLEIDTLHRLGGWPSSIYQQVRRYEGLVKRYTSLLKINVLQ